MSITKKWEGDESAVIDGHTNPWLVDELTGVTLDLLLWETTGHIPLPLRAGDECSTGCYGGVIPNMDTPEGVQACDECRLHEGDLEAAQALAGAINEANPALRVVVYYEERNG